MRAAVDDECLPAEPVRESARRVRRATVAY